MMTLQEAIAHAREVAENWKSQLVNCVSEEGRCKCKECATEHEQLAEWLTELQERREADRWNVIHTEADLPKESDWYLVSRVFNNRKYVDKAFFNDNARCFFKNMCTSLNSVIAWKPLLKPYKESEDQ